MSKQVVNWDEIRQEYETTDITMKALAEKHGVKSSTLRSRKNREGWQQATQHDGNVAKQRKNVATPKKAKDPPELVIDNDGLTDRQKMFCLLYLQYNFNATKAYRDAYDVSYKVANAHSYKLLSRVVIKEEIHRLKAKLQQDVYADTKDLIKEYVKQSFADITDYVDFGSVELEATDVNGNPVLNKVTGEPETYKQSFVALKNADEVDGTVVQEVKKGKDGVSVKLYDKQKALDVLLKYFGDDLKQELLQTQVDKAKLELAEAKANTIDEDDEAGDDGFIDAIDNSLDDVWGDLDA